MIKPNGVKHNLESPMWSGHLSAGTKKNNRGEHLPREGVWNKHTHTHTHRLCVNEMRDAHGKIVTGWRWSSCFPGGNSFLILPVYGGNEIFFSYVHFFLLNLRSWLVTSVSGGLEDSIKVSERQLLSVLNLFLVEVLTQWKLTRRKVSRVKISKKLEMHIKQADNNFKRYIRLQNFCFFVF